MTTLTSAQQKEVLPLTRMSYRLEGNLNQLAAQTKCLRRYDIQYVTIDLHHYLASRDDYEFAIGLFFLDGVPGWSGYKADLIKNGHCSEPEFFAKVDRLNEEGRSL